jgi:dolichol-phosphate mannosyltransferase
VAAELGGIDVMDRPAKAGLGTAYRAGFEWALRRGFEVIVEMDADQSHDPDDLPRLLAAVESGADLAVGSRYIPGGSAPAWSWHRRTLSREGNRFASAMLQLPVVDSTSGFRAYRATMLERLGLSTVRADGYSFQIEMAYRVASAGGRIVEIPIRFTDRRHGTSKMSGRIIAEALLLVTRWGVRRRVVRLAGLVRLAPRVRLAPLVRGVDRRVGPTDGTPGARTSSREVGAGRGPDLDLRDEPAARAAGPDRRSAHNPGARRGGRDIADAATGAARALEDWP